MAHLDERLSLQIEYAAKWGKRIELNLIEYNPFFFFFFFFFLNC